MYGLKILVSGIGTGIGKTVVSAILMHLLKASYWKPISSGEPGDCALIKKLVPNGVIYPETYRFKEPLSPHHAAALEGKVIDPLQFKLPSSDNLVIEAVGGVMVPINGELLTLDLFQNWPCHWIIVMKNYLGSINHTLLTVEALKNRGIKPLGFIFSGEKNPYSEEVILERTGLPLMARVEREAIINQTCIERIAKRWKEQNIYRLLLESSLREIDQPFGIPTPSS